MRKTDIVCTQAVVPHLTLYTLDPLNVKTISTFLLSIMLELIYNKIIHLLIVAISLLVKLFALVVPD